MITLEVRPFVSCGLSLTGRWRRALTRIDQLRGQIGLAAAWRWRVLPDEALIGASVIRKLTIFVTAWAFIMGVLMWRDSGQQAIAGPEESPPWGPHGSQQARARGCIVRGPGYRYPGPFHALTSASHVAVDVFSEGEPVYASIPFLLARCSASDI